jgi:hypothetical protein
MTAQGIDRKRVFRMAWVLALFAAAFAGVLSRADRILTDPDVYMHIAVGRWIIDHGVVPHVDVFSHTMQGMPWVPHEWLAEVAFGWLYEHFGWTGVMLATAFAVAVAAALLAGALLSYLPLPYAIAGAVLGMGLCSPHLFARPHMFTYPLIVLWTAGLVAANEQKRAPSLLMLPVMALWANLHGSFIFGIVLVVLFAGEALLHTSDWRSARDVLGRWSVFGLLTVAFALATPNGLAGFLLPLRLARMSFAASWIAEWRSPDFQQFQPLEAYLMLLLLGGFFLGLRLPVTRIAMMLVVLHMALSHVRHEELLGLLVPLLAAPALAAQLPPVRPRRDTLDGRRPSGWMPLAGVIVGALALAGVTSFARVGAMHPMDRYTPSAALAVAREHQVSGPVFNDFDFGGFLMFSGIPTFIDGRVELYGDDFLRRYSRIGELPRLLEQYQVTWILLKAGTAQAVFIDQLPGWQRLHADNVAVVYIRAPSTAAAGP